MHEPEGLLPSELIEQYLAQLQQIADTLAPTAAVQAIVNSNTALQHPKTMQYVCGAEHLGLAIGYLERAISGANTAIRNAALDEDTDPELGYEFGVRQTAVHGEQPSTADNALPPA